MAISKIMEEAINEQINKEFYSAYLYLSMESYFDSKSMKGFANWMRIQAQEEMTHAMKLFDHVGERGGKVTLKSIDKPNNDWKTPLDVFEEVYAHEIIVTKSIHNLAEIAEKEKDRSALSFLQWFIDEQVEEEASSDEIRQKLIMTKQDSAGIFMIDQELAQRIFTNSAGVASSIVVKKQMSAAKP